MPKPKRIPPWEPITVSVSPEARILLKVASAVQKTAPGAILDGLIHKHLGASPLVKAIVPQAPTVPADGAQDPGSSDARPDLTPEALRQELKSMGLTQAALAGAFTPPITGKAVSDWLVKGSIPADRQPEIRRILDHLKAKA